MSAATQDSYDYVVVGAGSAGCVLANRLSADPGCRVLLVEAGGHDRSPVIDVPLTWGLMFKRRWFDWGYSTEPAPHLDDRRLEFARGKVLGGCSSINAMVYSRGIPADYDGWAARFGLSRWSYRDVAPYFRRSEAWQGEPSDHRGDDGPLTVTPMSFDDPLVDAFLRATAECGHARIGDYNGPAFDGFGTVQATLRRGRRWNAASAYLRPALSRPNLSLRTRTHATRVLIERGRGVGVELSRRGRSTHVSASREVILCGGVVNSPQLLMLSGIGDAVALRGHGLPVHADAPGVGRNLHDHLAFEVSWHRREPGPLHAALHAGRLRPPYRDAFGAKGVCLTPESRGDVTLASADPAAAPRIRQRLLCVGADRVAARDLFRRLREIGERPCLGRFRHSEAAPGTDCRSDADIDAYLRRTASTLHHPVGTCRMGTDDDPQAVLDGRFRVRGVDGLRVVDASAMPLGPSGPINAVVMMMAERAADELLGRTAPTLDRATGQAPVAYAS